MQIFYSLAGILEPTQYRGFGLRFLSKITDAITNVPVTVFAKGAYGSRIELGQLNCNTIGLDWNMDIKKSRELIGNSKTLQGNQIGRASCRERV